MSEYILVSLAAAAVGTAYALRRETNKAKDRMREEIDLVPADEKLQYFESHLQQIAEINKEFPSMSLMSKNRDIIISLISSPTIRILKSLSREYLSKEDYLKFSEKLR